MVRPSEEASSTYFTFYGRAEAYGTTGGLCRDREGEEKEMEKAIEKVAGDGACLCTRQMVGLADRAGSNTILDAADSEGGHGAAKPDGVIHTYPGSSGNTTLTHARTSLEVSCHEP